MYLQFDVSRFSIFHLTTPTPVYGKAGRASLGEGVLQTNILPRRVTAQFARARAAAWKHAESGNFSFFSETETEKCPKQATYNKTQEITKEHVHLRRASVRQLPTPTAVVPRCRPCRSRSSYTATPWTVPDGLRRSAAA